MAVAQWRVNFSVGHHPMTEVISAPSPTAAKEYIRARYPGANIGSALPGPRENIESNRASRDAWFDAKRRNHERSRAENQARWDAYAERWTQQLNDIGKNERQKRIARRESSNYSSSSSDDDSRSRPASTYGTEGDAIFFGLILVIGGLIAAAPILLFLAPFAGPVVAAGAANNVIDRNYSSRTRVTFITIMALLGLVAGTGLRMSQNLSPFPGMPNPPTQQAK